MKQFCMENYNYYSKQKEILDYVERAKGNTGAIYTSTLKKMLKEVDKEFIKEGSPNELNIPYKIRNDYGDSLKVAPNALHLEPITKEVLKMMLLNTYPLYLTMVEENANAA
jgi:Regulator of G protein signaling domain